MKLTLAALVAGFLCLQAVELFAEVQVAFERLETGNGFSFARIDSPATNDAGTKASWKLVVGERDRGGARLGALHDGRVATDEDEPRANFFFRAGSNGGRIVADLGAVVPLKRISSYSYHTGDRAPQVYTVYGSRGEGTTFNGGPGRDLAPEDCGWSKIASVDTRPASGEPGGRYGVSITDSIATIGSFRYLLFAVEPTETRDRFGQTFFSEIDIVSLDGPGLEFVAAPKPPKLARFETDDGKYQFQIDTTEAADLHDWSEMELAAVVREWYPKIVEMLPSDEYQAAAKVTLRYRNDMSGGIPASASGNKINLNAPWFRDHLKDEAKGCVVHELVHVVQDYWQPRRGNPNVAPVPGWFVEGLADYIRWFLYEPESGGARLSAKQLAAAKHDASYRISANFIDWVVRTQDKDIVRKLNAAARDGKYDDSLWEIHTRKRLSDLAEEWRMSTP